SGFAARESPEYRRRESRFAARASPEYRRRESRFAARESPEYAPRASPFAAREAPEYAPWRPLLSPTRASPKFSPGSRETKSASAGSSGPIAWRPSRSSPLRIAYSSGPYGFTVRRVVAVALLDISDALLAASKVRSAK